MDKSVTTSRGGRNNGRAARATGAVLAVLGPGYWA